MLMYADTYSVNVPLPYTIGRPGRLMVSRLTLLIKSSRLESRQDDVTRLGSLRIFGIMWNVATRGWGGGNSFKISFCR